MKQLKELLQGVDVLKTVGDEQVQADAVYFCPKEAQSSSLYVALSNHHCFTPCNADGHDFITEVISAGTSVIVCQKLPAVIKECVTYVVVSDTKEALGIIASNFYDNPSTKLKLVAVTGTNGKTSTVNLLYHMFKQQGFAVGLLSTLHMKVDDEVYESVYTTPQVNTTNRMLAAMVKKNCQYCFMEASSEGIVQGRVAGLKFAGAVFTNLSQDHLDYHKTYSAYKKAKKMLFDSLSRDAFALANSDDAEANEMLRDTKASKYYYSMEMPSDFRVKVIESSINGLTLNIDGFTKQFNLLGTFNAYNILAAYATASFLCTTNRNDLLEALISAPTINGRLQIVTVNRGITAIVDYAHTPEALKQVLEAVKDLKSSRETGIICVFGCGGDRDRWKRPVMGKVALELSDQVVLTSDNSRNEKTEDIIGEIMASLDDVERGKVLQDSDRRKAIEMACGMAGDGDIIVLCGKGHETTQELGDRLFPFSDRQVITEVLQNCNTIKLN